MCAMTKSVFSHSAAEKGFSLLLASLAKGETPLLRCYSHFFNFRSLNPIPEIYLARTFQRDSDGLEHHFSGEFLLDRFSNEYRLVKGHMKKTHSIYNSFI